jgi:hypothetical protein
MTLLLAFIGAAITCGVLAVLALVTVDRWTARSTWSKGLDL